MVLLTGCGCLVRTTHSTIPNSTNNVPTMPYATMTDKDATNPTTTGSRMIIRFILAPSLLTWMGKHLLRS